MKNIILLVLVALAFGCTYSSFMDDGSGGTRLSGTRMYGPVGLTEKVPTISKLLSAIGAGEQEEIMRVGFKKPVINTEPDHSWAVVRFQDGLSTYVVYMQFFRVSELGKDVYFILRGVHTADGSPGDLQTDERANKVANALLKAIRAKI